MTSDADSPQPSPRDESPSSGDSDSTKPPQQSPLKDGFSHEDSPDSSLSDDLPEWEPLSPEILEEEAIRGDFVLRGAVVGLALLLGCAQILDSAVLVLIRSGEYLASHGFWPPSADPFAQTTAGKIWVNHHWLFDLIVAGVHHLGGGVGLSFFQGLLAGGCFWFLMNSALPHVRTWWTSVCGVLALLACFPDFSPQPELVTLLGTSCLLWLLAKFEQSPGRWFVIAIAATQWLWCQLDDRAYWGLVLLGGYSLGALTIDRRNNSADERYWLRLALFSSFVAGFLHPFPGRSWWQLIAEFRWEHPAIRAVSSSSEAIYRETLSPLSSLLWADPSLSVLAQTLLIVLTVAVMIFNRQEFHGAYGGLLAVALLLGLLAEQEMRVTAIVCVAIGSWNAQQWYLRRFGQIYRTEWRDVLFSRGGRAITVVAFFGFAWAILSGRLDGPGGHRTGIGFDDRLTSQMTGYKLLLADTYDNHPFHTHPSQGDLLIWAGGKSFVDSRFGLLAGMEPNDPIPVFNRTRQSLRAVPSTAGAADWRETFDRYEMTAVLPRLSGTDRRPDYETLDALLNSSDWQLTELNGASAVFCRTDLVNPTYATFLKSQAGLITRQAFSDPIPLSETLRSWPSMTTNYEKLFSQPRPQTCLEIQAARHFLVLAGANAPLSLRARAGMAILSIRNAQAGLKKLPNSNDAYLYLGLAYRHLGHLESEILHDAGVNRRDTLRYLQAVIALQQARAFQPADIGILTELYQLFSSQNRWDLALDVLQDFQEAKSQQPARTPDAQQAAETEQKNLGDLISRLASQVQQTRERIELRRKSIKDAGEARFTAALQAQQSGCLQYAIDLLEEDPVFLTRMPMARFLLGTILLETGRSEEASNLLSTELDELNAETIPGIWGTAAYGALPLGDYQEAIRRWMMEIKTSDKVLLGQLLSTAPLSTLSPSAVTNRNAVLSEAALAWELTQQQLPATASSLSDIARCEMEQGHTTRAIEAWTSLLERDTTGSLRPLARFYLYCLTDKLMDPEMPADWIPLDSQTLGPQKAIIP